MNQFHFSKTSTLLNLKYILVGICCHLQLGILIGQAATITNTD